MKIRVVFSGRDDQRNLLSKHAFDEVFDSWVKNFMAPNALAGSFSYKKHQQMRLA